MLREDFSQLRGRIHSLNVVVPVICDSAPLQSVSSAPPLFSCLPAVSCLILFPCYLPATPSLSPSFFLCLSHFISLSFSFFLSPLQSSYQQLSTLTNNNSVSKQLSLGSWKLRTLSGYVCRVVAVLQKAATRN